MNLPPKLYDKFSGGGACLISENPGGLTRDGAYSQNRIRSINMMAIKWLASLFTPDFADLTFNFTSQINKFDCP